LTVTILPTNKKELKRLWVCEMCHLAKMYNKEVYINRYESANKHLLGKYGITYNEEGHKVDPTDLPLA
jgi:hypothetical protein